MNKLSFEEKMEKVANGKAKFEKHLHNYQLSTDDCVIAVLTNNKACVELGFRYLPQLIEKHHLRQVFIFTAQMEYEAKYKSLHAKVCMCNAYCEVEEIAAYLSIFENENEIILFTDDDRWGGKTERLLSKGKFTLEEYVAIGLYRLDALEG